MRRVENIRNESAVSPVIGVLLMLVVTIIIAAVVSGFAGGLAGSQQSAPSASIDTKIDSNTGKMTFEMLSGESVSTKDLKITTYYVADNGTTVKHEQTRASDLYSGTRMPYLNDISVSGGSNNAIAHFGNYTFKTGDILSTGSWGGTGNLLGLDLSTQTNRDTWGLKSGSEVDVKILHTPSNKYIYEKKVSVI